MSSCCCLKTCGDAELNNCFTLTVFTFLWLLLSLCFSLGLLGSDRLLESSERSCGEQGFELPCLSQLPVELHFWLLLPSRRLCISTMCYAVTTIIWMVFISVLALVGLAGGDPMCWIRLVTCCCFFSGIADISFRHFLIPRSDVAGDAIRSDAISAALSASLLICLPSQSGVFLSYQGSASPSAPLDPWKHFCTSSHSSRWFFTFTIIVAVRSLSQILEQPISGILSLTSVKMQNEWQAWKLLMSYSCKSAEFTAKLSANPGWGLLLKFHVCSSNNARTCEVQPFNRHCLGNQCRILLYFLYFIIIL